MEPQPKRINPAIIGIIAVVLIGIAAGGIYAAKSNQSSTDFSLASSPSNTTDNTTATTTSNSTYKDGTYTATGSYSTPGGIETITVTATLAGNTISSVSADGSANGGDSAQYQSRFLSNYESLVVGKNINSVSLSRVSGSSLTSNGFNSALTKIKNEAVS
jgi:uncharacterized protein with FMN-binding domain